MATATVKLVLTIEESKVSAFLEMLQNFDFGIIKAVKLNGNVDLSSQDWWDDLTDEDKSIIEESLAEADRGEVAPHEEVMARFDALLEAKMAPTS